ncbi:hypothetical protein FHX42_003105 [Saccharopolyspora lacisalsi]|uniref:Peptide chain release factor 1 n=1 Tax=Halosaccharopolyspora lacisalsi TaxID=1000566 RepID=A0A839DYD5_9PSEU|nr:hypothetical protein [Halosaccharopolyspora lacisalsi]MBA8825739.1 hypothetical protein [Halosaccharopolyspora lacisalsi]
MKLGFLQGVYEHDGPFATVYLDTSADTEEAAQAIDLRWRSARQQLAERGADELTLQTLAGALSDHQWRTGQRGRLLVASQGRVVFSDELPQPPTDFSDDERAGFGALPHLMPYLRMRGARIPYVVAVVDHEGADITTVNAARESTDTEVHGSGGHPIRKTPSPGMSNERGHQRAVEEHWARNAADVAAEIDDRALSAGAERIVLAGTEQQRGLVHERLRKKLQDMVMTTGAGHRDRKASDEVLQQEVSESIRSAVEAREAETIQEFERERGEHDRAVHGWQSVVGALQRGQVRTLLRASSGVGGEFETLRIGPAANEVAVNGTELERMGVDGITTVPADAAVVRALVGTDAELVFVDPGKVELDGGIGAVLRYSDVSTAG